MHTTTFYLQVNVSIIACQTLTGVMQYYAPNPAPPTSVKFGPINLGSGKSEMSYDASKKVMSCRFTYDNKQIKRSIKQVELQIPTVTVSNLFHNGLKYS